MCLVLRVLIGSLLARRTCHHFITFSFFNDSPGNKATYATNKVIGSKTHSMKWSLKWMSPPQGDREVTQVD